MKIIKPAQAGTLESNDIYVQLYPNPHDTIEIQLQSVVMKQFGKRIKEVILETLLAHGVTSCICVCEDKGALDFTIMARVKSAIGRSV